MNVIGHAVDGDKLLLLVSSNPGDVFVQGFLVPLWKETMPALHGKDHVNVDTLTTRSYIHAKIPFKDEYLDLLEKFQIDYDERYVFDWMEEA